jgi:hypothetical protein
LYIYYHSSLSDFITLQHHWSDTLGRQASPERLCAYINNMRYFAHLLHDKQQTLHEEIYDSCRINDVFAVTIQAFLLEAERGVTVLTNSVTADFREGLLEGLFKDDWLNSKQTVETLRITLSEYVTDLKAWLPKENDIKLVLLGVLRVVSTSYLECLLISCLSVTGSVGERLQQDYEVIVSCFHDCAPYLQADIVDREVYILSFFILNCPQLKPLGDTISVLRMDLRRMAQFVRNDLYTDFGR